MVMVTARKKQAGRKNRPMIMRIPPTTSEAAAINPQKPRNEVIPTTLNASALRDPEGRVIGAIGILRDMRAYEQVLRDLEQSKSELQEKILDLEKFEEVVVGRELKMIALEKELDRLRNEVERVKPGRA